MCHRAFVFIRCNKKLNNKNLATKNWECRICCKLWHCPFNLIQTLAQPVQFEANFGTAFSNSRTAKVWTLPKFKLRHYSYSCLSLSLSFYIGHCNSLSPYIVPKFGCRRRCSKSFLGCRSAVKCIEFYPLTKTLVVEGRGVGFVTVFCQAAPVKFLSYDKET